MSAEHKPHIERYEFQHDSMYSATDGEWVKWDDYARLEEQLETAEDHIAGLCDNLLRYGRHTNSCDFRIGGCNCGWETMREALKTPNPAESHD